MIHPKARIGNGTVLHYPELSNIGDCVIGDNGKVHSHVWIGNKVRVGHGVRIQAFAFIPTGVTIHDGVFIGPHVVFCNDKHPPSPDWEETVVFEGASIGAGAIILPGITIGAQAIVGAGAVVTHNVSPGETVVGNPARPLK